jgi:LysR family transcriptional regulator for bpeEF and oprC
LIPIFAELPMDMLQAMRIFVTVVEQGSFAKAAYSLQMHRPNITREIKNLESYLNVRLLHRTTRKQTLTDAGALFHDRCLHILSAVDETKELFAQAGVVPKGKLRLDLPVTLGKSIIIPALHEFADKYPAIDLIVGTSDQAVDLVAEGVDCVVRIGKLQNSSLIAKQVGELKMVTCASPGYLARHGQPTTLEDLDHHRAVNYFGGKERRVLEWEFKKETKTIPIKVTSGLQVNDSDALVAGALAGFGLLQALEITVKDHLRDGRLVPVLKDFPRPSKSIWVMYPHRQNLPTQVRLFVEWVSELFAAAE